MAFCVAERTILPDEIAEAKGEEKGQQEYWLLTVTPDEYVQLRDAYFMGNGYIRWDRDAIAYVLLENDYADGYAYKVQHHGREELLLFREEENAIEVLETTLSEQDLLAVLKFWSESENLWRQLKEKNESEMIKKNRAIRKKILA